MRLKSFLHFGYTKSSVNRYVRRLNSKIDNLNDIIETKDQEIEQLRQELLRARSQEELIQEVILDAKHLSRKLVTDAKSEANNLMAKVEADLSADLSKVESNLLHLKGVKDNFVVQEKLIQNELKENLNRYLALIDQNILSLDSQNNSLEKNLQQTESLIENSQKIIQFKQYKQEESSDNTFENML